MRERDIEGAREGEREEARERDEREVSENQNQNQNRFIRSYYRPRIPPLRPIWSLSQRPPGKKYIHECMYVKVKLVNTSKS